MRAEKNPQVITTIPVYITNDFIYKRLKGFWSYPPHSFWIITSGRKLKSLIQSIFILFTKLDFTFYLYSFFHVNYFNISCFYQTKSPSILSILFLYLPYLVMLIFYIFYLSISFYDTGPWKLWNESSKYIAVYMNLHILPFCFHKNRKSIFN